MEGEFTRLLIDELPDEFIQEIVPLTHEAVFSFLTDYKKFVDVFATWSRIHLWFLHKWAVTTTRKPFNFLDWLKEEAVVITRNEIIEKFKTVHHTEVSIPVIDVNRSKYFDTDEDDWGLLVLNQPRICYQGKYELALSTMLLKWQENTSIDASNEELPFYEGVTERLSEYLNRIVNGLRRDFELKYEGNIEVFERGTIEPADRTEWFQHMVQKLYVIDMAFKVLGSLWECCDEVFNVLQDSSNGEDSRFKGKNASVLQSRIAFLMALTVSVLLLVDDWHDEQKEDVYHEECYRRFSNSRIFYQLEDNLPDSSDQDDLPEDQMVEIPVQLPESISENCPGDLVYKRKFIGFEVHSPGHLYWKRNLVGSQGTRFRLFSIKNIKESGDFMDLDFFQRRIQERNGLYSM